MPVFLVQRNFQYNGSIVKANIEGTTTINMSKAAVEIEKKRGKHKKTGKWLSPILNHCIPGDAETAELVDGKEAAKKFEETKANVTEVRTTDRKEEIYAELDLYGKAYSKRWGLEKLENELKKARRESPLIDAKQDDDEVIEIVN